MYDVGIRNILNIDLSGVVIQQMAARNKQRKEMKFVKMDMLNVRFDFVLFSSLVSLSLQEREFDSMFRWKLKTDNSTSSLTKEHWTL